MITFGTSSPTGLSNLAMRLEVSAQLHRIAFSDSDWNRIVRASLHQLGEWFIGSRLPLRFGEYARTNLGYDRKEGGLTSKQLLAVALADGTMQKLADRFFHGYNPWRPGKAPGPLWQKWLSDGRKAGRYNFSVTGTFSGAKRDLRRYVKEQLRRELYAKASDVPEKFLTPLVHAGELREAVLGNSTVTATATASAQKVRISMPDPHGQSHPIVGAVLRRLAPEEVVEAEIVFGTSLDALINGASSTTVKRGPNAGQARRQLTGEQRESIAHTISRQRGGVAQMQH